MIAVSILIPCYNTEKFIRQCLHSVVNQTLKQIEIICINDGSTDSTPDILAEYAAKDSRITVIDKPNSGYGDSMNKGIEAAKGEYIGIVEADDWADANMFESLYRLAQKHNADIVKSNFYDYYDGQSFPRTVIPQNDAESVICPKQRTDIFKAMPCIWSAVYRRSWLNAHRIRFLPTPGASYQDASFNFKTLACAERAWFTNAFFLHYRKDNENSSVKDVNKVYCVCDEYEEITNFINTRHELTCLHATALEMKYYAYRWNFQRLTIPTDCQFAMHAAEEFRRDFTSGHARGHNFKPKDYRKLQCWAFRPRLFILKELFNKHGRKKLIRTILKSFENRQPPK